MTATLLLALISPVVAILIALWGFRRSTRADKLRAFFEIQERYLASDVRAGRRSLHVLVAGKSDNEIAQIDPAVLSNVGHALAVMNSIAIACESGYVTQELIDQSMGRSFTNAMAAARPYIDHIEYVRGFRPYPFAERLATLLAASEKGRFAAPQANGAVAEAPQTQTAVQSTQLEGNDEGRQS